MDDELIGLSDLLKATMTAAIEADKEAAENYYSALKSYAYEKDSHGKAYTDKLDYFKIDVPNTNGEVQEIAIPKISMMPMPLLHITEANFDIEGDMVLCESSDPTGELTGGNGQLKESRIGVSVEKNIGVPAGSGGGTTSDKNVKTNLRITVKMEQSDLPAGLGILLQTIANNTKIETK